VARERPLIPIVCVTPNEKTYRRMALLWGATTLMGDYYDTIDRMFEVVEHAIRSAGMVQPDDKIVIISGVPFGTKGATNFVKIHTIEE
jgi:pyruvate kinase